MIPVKEIMTLDISVIGLGDTVQNAVEKMSSRKISCLVVVDGNVPAGIITTRDVMTKLLAAKRNPEQTRVQDIMSAPIITYRDSGSLLDLFGIMKDQHIKQIPIVDANSEVVGIVTQTDLVYAVQNMLERLA